MQQGKPFSASLAWLVNEFEKFYILFEQMIVRVPPLEMKEKHQLAFTMLQHLHNAMVSLSHLIELWDSTLSSVNQSPSFQSKIARCSRCMDRVLEQFENEKCRALNIFSSEQLNDSEVSN